MDNDRQTQISKKTLSSSLCAYILKKITSLLTLRVSI